MNTEEYVKNKWKETERFQPRDSGTLIGLPYRYTVPTATGMFNELYYWDTYFANKGLLIDGKADLAINNCKNMLFLVEKYGYMPNGSRTYYLGRSQPPYLALMVADLYDFTKDAEFLKTAFPALKKEYDFWETKRATPTGLNRYFNEHTEKECRENYETLTKRVRSPFTDPFEGGRNLLAEAESGWDFNPRFHGMCTHFNPVDLNANLYAYEKLFARFERELSVSDGSVWDDRAASRQKKINALCWNTQKSIYCDYDFTENQTASLCSAASFWPYFMKVAPEEKICGLQNALRELEAPYGILTATKTREKYQWGYPNVWSPCVYAAVIGCLNYGLKKEAGRIAEKYILLIEKNFRATGGLWEKYNAVDGTTQCANEYEMPQMMGWTAGVYKAFKKMKKERFDR